MALNNPGIQVLDIGEGHITILPPSYSSIGQGTWALTLSASIYLAMWDNSPSDDLDNISYKVYLQPGTYTLALLVTKAASAGILDVDIDTTEIASFDLYNASTSYNNRVSQASITVSTGTLKTLRLRCHGKNVASSDFLIGFSYIALWRTA